VTPPLGAADRTLGSRWRDWRGLVGLLAVMLVFRSAVADWNQVPSGSMLPSILIGDRIVVDKLAYDLRVPFTMLRIARWADPARGDVVTFLSPEDGRLLVKRVVGVPGDLVGLDDNRLVVNGVAATYAPLRCATPRGAHAGQSAAGEACYQESILGRTRSIMLGAGGGARSAGNFAMIRVGDGHFLVLGDNRDASRDSRALGLIARDRIVGHATRVAFSLDGEAGYRPRADRFLAELH
jgi:signal peptidase I